MARMIPDIELADVNRLIPDNRPGASGERFVYCYMKKNLPDDWVVVYNFSCRAADGQHAQLDFLVFVPSKGIVNVDAKGTGYHVFPGGKVALTENGDNVFEQACTGAHVLNKYLRDYVTRGQDWGSFGSLVAFAFLRFSGSLIGGNPYMDASDFVQEGVMKKKILDILDSHNWAYRAYVGWEKAILAHFLQSRDVSEVAIKENPYDAMEAYSLRGLDPEQRVIANAIHTNRYIHVTGGAGTGKTLIALAVAKDLALEGRRVLYICYNKALAASLKRVTRGFQLGDNASCLKICNFHKLGQELFNKDLTVTDGSGFNRPRTDENIARQIPVLLQKTHLKRFNALLIDEAQDLSQDNIRALMPLLVRDNRTLAVFSDAAQTIFSLDWELDTAMFEAPLVNCKLDRNYRNTDKIYKHFQPLSQENTKPMMVSGSDFVTKNVEECLLDDVKPLIERKLADGVPPSQIAVLSIASTPLSTLDSVHNHSTNRRVGFTPDIEKWFEGDKILKSTVQAFKGLDANCVFFIPGKGEHYKQNEWEKLRYVGESRAKFELYIVCDEHD